MPQEDDRLFSGTRKHAGAKILTNEKEAENLFGRIFKVSYLNGIVQSWVFKDTAKRKR